MKKTGENFVFIFDTFISYGYFCLEKNERTYYLWCAYVCVCVCVCRFMYVFVYMYVCSVCVVTYFMYKYVNMPIPVAKRLEA